MAELSDWREPRPLGRGGLEVTGLGLGCAPLGNLFTTVSDEEAAATVHAAWEAGIRLFDTAPLYGHGLSERRLGQAMRAYPREAYVLSTKVGRLVEPGRPPSEPGIFARVEGSVAFDYSADGVRRSVEESLQRLGTDRIDIALVHDPDDHEAEATASAFPTLIRLREEGAIRTVGAGMNQVAMLERFVERLDLDCILLAGRYTLLDRSGAEHLLPLCAARGVGVLLGGVFNSGVLADPGERAVFDYEPARADVLARAEELGRRAAEAGISLPAAAVAFARSHPAVTSVVIGARSAAEIRADVEYASADVPPSVWE